MLKRKKVVRSEFREEDEEMKMESHTSHKLYRYLTVVVRNLNFYIAYNGDILEGFEYDPIRNFKIPLWLLFRENVFVGRVGRL